MENIKIDINEHGKGELQIFEDGAKAGKMDILITKSALTVYHTEVFEEYEGRGFARMLLEHLVEYARANHLTIIPLCPYVHKQFSLHPEKYADVWNKEWHQ